MDICIIPTFVLYEAIVAVLGGKKITREYVENKILTTKGPWFKPATFPMMSIRIVVDLLNLIFVQFFMRME
jgi:hypothetical protein